MAGECRGLCSQWGPNPAELEKKKKKTEAGNQDLHQRVFCICAGVL